LGKEIGKKIVEKSLVLNVGKGIGEVTGLDIEKEIGKGARRVELRD